MSGTMSSSTSCSLLSGRACLAVMAIALCIAFVLQPVSGLDDGMDTPLTSSHGSFVGVNDRHQIGNDTCDASDLNGDGYDDIVIGASNGNALGNATGEVHIFLGGPSGWGSGTAVSNADMSFTGEAAGDAAGNGLACGGDVNGDGYDDLLVSALLNDEAGQEAGQVYLILGGAAGWSGTRSLAAADASFLGENEYDAAALGVSLSGDLNGDGYDDIVIGVHNNGAGGTAYGQVYIIYGKASGWAMDTSLSTADASFIGDAIVSWFGSKVRILEDVNGDGLDDLLIGAYNDASGGGDPLNMTGAGKVHMVFGRSSGWAMGMSISGADASFVGESAREMAGFSVAGAGDVNGDGLGDLIIGIPLNDDGGGSSADGTGAGKACLYFGKMSGWTKGASLALCDVAIVGDKAGDYIGYSVSGAGDVDGDGLDDVLLGAYGEDGGGSNAGKAYLFLGRLGGWGSVMNAGQADASYTGEGVSNLAGFHVSGGGDVDGDGNDDVLVTSPYNSAGGVLAGKVHLISPEANSPPDPVVSVKVYRDDALTIMAENASIGDRLYIELSGTDGDPTRIDVALVSVGTDVPDGRGFTMWLREIGADTGRYAGELGISDVTDAEAFDIGVVEGANVTVTSVQDATKGARVFIGELVAPPPPPPPPGGKVNVEPSPLSDPVVIVPTTAVVVTTVAVVGLVLLSDVGRWAVFKLVLLGLYSKRKDEKVLDNFVRGWVQGVVVRDPGVRPVDVVETFEGSYTPGLIYYHINELVKFGYIYMVQRDRKGSIVRVRRGRDGRIEERTRPTRKESETDRTLQGATLRGLSLHLYPEDVVAPDSQLNLRKKQRQEVFRLVSERPGMNQKEIGKAMDMSRQAVAYHLKEMERDGLVKVEAAGRSRYYHADRKKGREQGLLRRTGEMEEAGDERVPADRSRA